MENPAQSTLVFAIKRAKSLPALKERPPINLLDNIKKHVTEKGLKLDDIKNIWNLREKAKDEKRGTS